LSPLRSRTAADEKNNDEVHHAMPFEYGSQQVEIPNPFRFEGAVYTARAVVLILLGLYALFQVRAIVAAGDRPLAIVDMVGGMVLVGFGVYAAYVGLYKVFRFYVGRGQPADLASTVSSQQSVMPGAPTGGSTGFKSIYSPVMLADMLLGRKNPTFKEPEGWLPRMLHSFVRNLIFLPYALRNDAGSRFVAAAHSVVLLALLGLAWFSGVTNLVPMEGTPVMAWLVTVVTAMLAVIWFRESLRKSHAARAMLRFSLGQLVVWAALAVIAPFALVALNGVRPLPAPPFSPYPWFFAILVVGAASFGYSLFLAMRRAPQVPPPTQVSEYREHWQESVHPMDIFRAVEITLAKHRFQEIPNRIYENNVPELMAQGSQNKGEFNGRTVQEIQPQPIADRRGDAVIKLGIVAGQVLLLAAGFVLFAMLLRLQTASTIALGQTLLAAFVLWIAGRLIARTSNLYVSEIEFESDLIVFAVTGTFSESRVATGMSVYDSTRSENVIVRSSLTPWMLVSRLHSSTLTVSGSANLEQPRLVLGMRDNEALSRDLVADARSFLRDRQIMATVGSEADLQAAANIYQMNERTRAHAEGRAGQAPFVTQETRDDKLVGTSGPESSSPGSSGGGQ
jgi:hypothetical protein